MSIDLTTTPPGSGRLKRILREGMRWLLRFSAVAVLLVTLFVVLTPQGRAGFHTALFVLQMLEVPVKPQSWFTDDALRQEVHYLTPYGTAAADIYRLPDGKPRAAVLLSLGANDTGRDDENAVNLGHALARAGYVVMIHWSPTMGLHANIDPAEPEKLVWAFQYLEERGYVDRTRVGLGGFCVGASLALVAAADARIRDRVHFVNAFGPFFDAEALLLQAASRSVVYKGERTPWEPDSLTFRVLANELIETLDDSHVADVLRRHYLKNQAETTFELAGLSQSGMTVVRLLDGVEPHEAEALYSTLPSSFHEGLVRVSPATHVADLRARLFVMHDRNDQLVPAAESRRLVEATRDRINVRYTEFMAFDHLVPGPGGAFTRLGQAVRLYRHMYDIIRMAS